MSNGLNLNDIEMQRYQSFKMQHCGVVYFKVYLGGIGTKIIVCCEGCKEEYDITDYDCW